MEWMYSRADVVKAFEKHGVKTPLWAAARLGDLQTMSIRLDEKAHVRCAIAGRAVAPLHIAAKEGQLAAVDLLLKCGADVTCDLGSMAARPCTWHATENTRTWRNG